MADIFVSHTSGDRDWALWVAKKLVVLGHTSHVDALKIGAGKPLL
jgi:hypothetical protein